MSFFKQFLKNPVHTGAVAPSSKSLSQLITETADLSNKKCIVELGSGTGSFTKKILEQKNKDSVFFSLEINKEFVKRTRNNCPKATVYLASAENIEKYLKKNGQKKCDCIISGLPWAAFNKEMQTKLLSAVYKSLENNGEFLTFAYVHSKTLPSGISFEKLLKSKFKTVNKTAIVWKNVPPAFVYHCVK